jgi:hypothetical protein
MIENSKPVAEPVLLIRNAEMCSTMAAAASQGRDEKRSIHDPVEVRMLRKAATAIILAGLGFGLPTNALADRVYKSCEDCNSACHGACFMLGEGCNCVFGAMRTQAKGLGVKSRNYNQAPDVPRR